MFTDGIILDIDGTLWDSTGLVATAWNQALKDLGSPVRVTADQLKTLFGKPMDVILEAILPDADAAFRQTAMETCIAAEDEVLATDPCRIFYPDVAETIRDLSQEIPFFIVSNCQKGYIERVCEKGGFAPFITDHLCFGDTWKGKAENLLTLVARNRLQAPVYVGDTAGDEAACRLAGVPFIFASYGFGRAEEPAAVISSFSDLRNLIEGESDNGSSKAQ